MKKMIQHNQIMLQAISKLLHKGKLFIQNKRFYVAWDVTRLSTWLWEYMDFDKYGPPSHLCSILGK